MGMSNAIFAWLYGQLLACVLKYSTLLKEKKHEKKAHR
jgi:hypothetical protein